MSYNEYKDWPRYFHVTPMMLGEGSIILPGNWGRILKLYQQPHVNAALYRETVFEQIRSSEFPHKPSRLNCLFFLPSLQDAVHYRNAESPFGVIHEIAVNTDNTELHFGDYNFGGALASVQLLESMPHIAREYWSVEATNSVEILFSGSAVVLKRH